ncbi:hypothetical protein [Zavarzinella formosa]|uniref:hypothetical protein n=1 Tax=Zavarzinella formosa TaxID=360055 RepID=UPI00031CDA87|nr:hypothetical protein [Zavarzinella formosa]
MADYPSVPPALEAAMQARACSDDPSFDTPLPGRIIDLGEVSDGGEGRPGEIEHVLRARGDVELLLTKDELNRLLRQAVSAAEASPDWGPGREFFHEVTDDAHVFEGEEPSSFTIAHLGTSYDIRYYDGFATEFIQ